MCSRSMDLLFKDSGLARCQKKHTVHHYQPLRSHGDSQVGSRSANLKVNAKIVRREDKQEMLCGYKWSSMQSMVRSVMSVAARVKSPHQQ